MERVNVVGFFAPQEVNPSSTGGEASFLASPRWLFFICVAGALSIFSSGCASRHPVAASTPPLSPSTNSSDASESASRGNVPPPVAPGPRRRSNVSTIPVIPGSIEEGNASWYGNPFHGRRSSNGEIYDMHKLTAAHRTLPFETIVKVTNLNNGKSTTVRITDRGPFVENRIIDLSQAAAREIDSIGQGVVPVRVEILSAGADPSAGFFTVQIGAFRDRANAERLRERLSASYSPIFVQQYDSEDGSFYRLRVGKIAGEEAAQEIAEQLRSREGLTPIVLRFDDAQQ